MAPRQSRRTSRCGLALGDRRAVGADAPVRHDVRDHVEPARARVHLLRDDLVLVEPTLGEAEPAAVPEVRAAHLRPRDDVARRLGVLVDRRAAALGRRRRGDPRLHVARRVAAGGVGAQTDVGADGEVAAGLVEQADEALERARGQHVVGVEEADERRVDEIEPRVAGGAQPGAMLVAHDAEPRVRGRGVVEDSGRGIRRGVVDQDRGPLLQALPPQRVECVHRVRGDVVAGHDDGDRGGGGSPARLYGGDGCRDRVGDGVQRLGRARAGT